MHSRFIVIGIVLFVLIVAGLILWFMLQPKDTVAPAETPTTGERECVVDEGPYHRTESCSPSSTPLGDTAGDEAERGALDTLRTFSQSEVALFKKQNVEALTAEDVAVQGLGGERIYTLEVDYQTYESPTTVSYVYHMFADTLGAHPNAYYRTFTFHTSSGRIVSLSDLFTDIDYLSVLSESSRELLRAVLGENASIEMLEAGTTARADNFQHFYLDENGLVIIFAPYQVGPWSIGTQEVHIPPSDVENILKPEYR